MDQGRPQHGALSGIAGDPAEWAPRLRGILEEQRRLCRELEVLSAEQGTLLRAGDTDGLLRVLGLRQGVVDGITVLNAALEPFRREWEACMGRLSPAQRGELEGALKELGELVDRITVRDEADRRELEQRRAVVSAQITGVSRGRVAMSAYGARLDAGGPLFQDRSC